MVTHENYEEYLMLDADGELDSAGKKALQAFMAANPALKDAQTAWQSIKLTPDISISYGGKNALLKRPKRIVLGWNVRTMAAAAAIILVLVSIPLIWRDRPQDRIVSEFPAAKALTDALPPKLAPGPDITDVVVRPKVARAALIAARHETPESSALDTMTVPDALVSNPSGSLSIAAINAPAQPVVVLVSNVALQDPPLPDRESGLPEIRFAEANQQAIKALKRGLDERASQISNAAKAIRETAFAVRIGNKNHYLNF